MSLAQVYRKNIRKEYKCPAGNNYAPLCLKLNSIDYLSFFLASKGPEVK